MNYGDILTRAWQITWKYKVLWIFGILAGCGSSNGNANGNSGNASYTQNADALPPEVIRFFERSLEFLKRPEVIIGLAIAFLLFITITVFLSNIGRIALINGTYQAEQGAEKLAFGELFRAGVARFWRFFGMNLLVSLPFIIAILALVGVGAGAVMATNGGMGEEILLAIIPLICVLFCIIFIVSIAIGIFIQQAQNAMLVEDLGIIDSLKRGWQVLKNNLGHIILMALILFIIGAVAGFVIALPIMIIVVPAIFSFALGQAESFRPLIIMGLCLVAYMPVAIVIDGILTTYIQASWTLTYLHLTQPSPEQPKEDTIIEYA